MPCRRKTMSNPPAKAARKPNLKARKNPKPSRRMPENPKTEKRMNNSLPYRPGVGMMLINADNRVFVARRIDTRAEAWQRPQGGIDAGESPRGAANRAV